jgi:hypothetical protein
LNGLDTTISCDQFRDIFKQLLNILPGELFIAEALPKPAQFPSAPFLAVSYNTADTGNRG